MLVSPQQLREPKLLIGVVTKQKRKNRDQWLTIQAYLYEKSFNRTLRPHHMLTCTISFSLHLLGKMKFRSDGK